MNFELFIEFLYAIKKVNIIDAVTKLFNNFLLYCIKNFNKILFNKCFFDLNHQFILRQ